MSARNYETIEFLFENGSKINIENNNGERLIDNIILSSINIEEKYKIIARIIAPTIDAYIIFDFFILLFIID